jgi:hypothetical protein
LTLRCRSEQGPMPFTIGAERFLVDTIEPLEVRVRGH